PMAHQEDAPVRCSRVTERTRFRPSNGSDWPRVRARRALRVLEKSMSRSGIRWLSRTHLPFSQRATDELFRRIVSFLEIGSGAQLKVHPLAIVVVRTHCF